MVIFSSKCAGVLFRWLSCNTCTIPWVSYKYIVVVFWYSFVLFSSSLLLFISLFLFLSAAIIISYMIHNLLRSLDLWTQGPFGAVFWYIILRRWLSAIRTPCLCGILHVCRTSPHIVWLYLSPLINFLIFKNVNWRFLFSYLCGNH